MQSNIERISQVECRVQVEIPWVEVSPRLAGKLRDLQRRARVPGFRPGKVPSPVIERMYGKSVRTELANEIVQETFQTAVSEHETTPLSQPVLENHSLEQGQPFTYSARFEVPPALDPTGYDKAPVRRRPAVVDASKVEAELTRLRESLAEMRPIDPAERTKTQPLDVWTVDIEGSIGDQRVAQKDVQVEIGKSDGEFVPGLANALGELELATVGRTHHVSFTPAEDRVHPNLRGKTAELDLGLRDVRSKHLPALDDDFARDTGEAESLAELRTKLEDQVRVADTEEAERDARRRLVGTLLERNPFEPAPTMVAREVAAQVDQTKRQLTQQGMRLADLGTTESSLAQRIRPQAVFNVKAFLLLDAIGKKEEIDVTDEAFEDELKKMADESGQNLQRMRATMEKNGQVVLLRAQMREERILDHLMERASVTEAPDPEGEDAQDTPPPQ